MSYTSLISPPFIPNPPYYSLRIYNKLRCLQFSTPVACMAKSDGGKIPAVGGAKTVLPAASIPAPYPVVNAPSRFLTKTYEMVEDSSSDKIVSWSGTNSSFIVWDPPEFCRTILPKYFKHNNFSSFVRQLNSYGFRKVDPDRWEFANEGFLRGQRHLLRTIVRRRPAHGQNQQPPQPRGHSSSVGACVEVGTFGLEEEAESLNRDKNVLMQEVVKLRQHQQATEDQLQKLMKRLQEMEQRQQQIMSFLALAFNNPGHLLQLIQQQESSKRSEEGNKRRRLKPDCIPNNDSGTPADGQIIKYEPYVNEAAKAMFNQIKKLNAPPRLEKSGLDRVLSDISSVSNALDFGSSMTCNSGVALSEVPPISAQLYVSSASGVTSNGPSTSISEIQALQPAVTSDALATTLFPDVSSLVGAHELPSVDLPSGDINVSKLSKLQEMVLENNVNNPSRSYGAFLDPIPPVDQTMSLEIGGFSPDPGINWNNSLLDEMQPQLTLDDPSWEEFLAPILVAGNGEEVDSTPLGNPTQTNEAKPPENVWSTAQMQELAEQMGHLSSDTKKV